MSSCPLVSCFEKIQILAFDSYRHVHLLYLHDVSLYFDAGVRTSIGHRNEVGFLVQNERCECDCESSGVVMFD